MSYDPRAAGCRCDVCPCNNQRPVPPEIKDSPILLVGEGPGYLEQKLGGPFKGPSGVKLMDLLKSVKMKRSDVSISNAALCRPEVPDFQGKDKYDAKKYMTWLGQKNKALKQQWSLMDKTIRPPTPPQIASPFDCCRPRLLAEMAHTEEVAKRLGLPNGGVIIPLGNFALASVTGDAKATGILKWRGSVLMPDYGHPAYDE